MINPVIIFGAGTLGKTALDIFTSNQVVVFGFLDDNPALHNTEIGEILVLGNTDDERFLSLLGQKCDAFVAIEDSKEREYLYKLLHDRKIVPINAVHAEASVSSYAALGHGNLMAAGSRISAFTQIGDGCQIHPNAVVESDCQIGNKVTIGAGTVVGSNVSIGDSAFIGTGATILSGVAIGKNTSVGAGSVVLSNVNQGSKVFGFPAKVV